MSKVINWFTDTNPIWIASTSYYWDFSLDNTLRSVTNIDTFIDYVMESVSEFFYPFGNDEVGSLDQDQEVLSLSIGREYNDYTKLEDFEKVLRATTELTSMEIQMSSTTDQPNFSTITLKNTENLEVFS